MPNTSIDKILDKIYYRVRDSIQNEIYTLFIERLIPQVLDNIMSVYDEELVSNEPGYDPAKPSVARELFKNAVKEELYNTARKDGLSVSFGIEDVEDIIRGEPTQEHLKGVGAEGSPNPLEWLIFYLEGFPGDYAFITEAVYKELKSKDSVPEFEMWGWYGQGFLIERKVYFAQKLDSVVPFASVRHPFSGVKPVNLLGRVLEGIDMRSIFKESIKRAIKNL